MKFIMEHEHYSYPDALRFLAKKYGIEIAEETPTPEQAILRDEKESMMVLNGFAQKCFSENLFDTEEGKSIGLTYFRERGFTDTTIRTFQLGYALNAWDVFTKHAISSGYQQEFLVKTGLTVKREGERESLYDRFKGRVIFPIHNLSGRVIGFGGRILKKDEKAAKYVNSPESEVYHKSKVLYGLYQAKKAIVQNDVCYLAEGYTDVISLHQSGVENAVASSGTSLTSEQVRLISRYTRNVTILYDGDEAGIKASLRGIDMILEEGLNVRIVLFPDGDDPDSYASKHSARELVNFIANNAKDFVLFKTGLLMKDVSDDPIRKAQLIRDVVETIARIPDAISRSTYVKHCASLMEMDERVLISELNKLRRNQLRKETGMPEAEQHLLPVQQEIQTNALDTEFQEREILRLLLNFGNEELDFAGDDEPDGDDGRAPGSSTTVRRKVMQFVRDELARDEIGFSNPLFVKLYDEIVAHADSRGELISNYFLAHEDPQVSSFAVEMMSPRYFLSENWDTLHGIFVPEEKMNLRDSVEKSIYHLKNKKVARMIEENQRKIKEAHSRGENIDHLIRMQMTLDAVKQEISKVLGIDILK